MPDSTARVAFVHAVFIVVVTGFGALGAVEPIGVLVQIIVLVLVVKDVRELGWVNMRSLDSIFHLVRGYQWTYGGNFVISESDDINLRCPCSLTSDSLIELHRVEVLPADGATVSSLHPWGKAGVMQMVSARDQAGNQFFCVALPARTFFHDARRSLV